MSKFLLNLFLQIFQALVNSKSNFIRKELFLRIPPTRPSRPAHFPGFGLPAGPTLPGPNRQPTRPLQPASPRMPLAYFAEDVFFFDSRLPSSAPSLSPLADAWAPLVSSFVHPAPADPDCVATESRCVQPLRPATLHLEMPPEPLLAPQSFPPLHVAP
jgi:hypothetical protein